MPLKKALLLLASVVFLGWMAYLIHLALTHRHATVLSRPQFLISQVVIVVHFDSQDELKSPLAIKEVLFGAKELKNSQEGKEPKQVEVTNLAQCAPQWSGPGDYLIPLEPAHDDAFMVTPIPRSPGYPGSGPRIYRWTHETEDQFKHLAMQESAAQ